MLIQTEAVLISGLRFCPQVSQGLHMRLGFAHVYTWFGGQEPASHIKPKLCHPGLSLAICGLLGS